ncbi:MAG: hypothetical protein K6E98_00115 [Lachnospiraceae bacterium]|nr:hypothetical protein [Lachnospiraceae bacterium]
MHYIILIFIIHILVILILCLLRFLKILKCDYINIFVAFFVPLFGVIMLLRKRYSDRHSERESEKLDVTRPMAEEEKKSIPVETDENPVVPLSEALALNDSYTRRDIMMDILYSVNKSIIVDDDEIKEKVVPLEEALVVNDMTIRRKLIIDVLYAGAGDYVAQLNDAKENKDTEVVHYAATALAEIQKDFDLKFQEIMTRKASGIEDPEIDNDYQYLLESYIASGLLEGNALKNQLRIYTRLLDEKLKKSNIKGRWTLLNKKAHTDLRLRDSEELDKDIELMLKRWPEHENVYIYRIQSAILKRDSAAIKRLISEIRLKNKYMSSDLRSMVQYWET